MPSLIAARRCASASVPLVRYRRALRVGLSAVLAFAPMSSAFAVTCDTSSADCEILYSRTFSDPNTYDFRSWNSLDLMSTSAGSPTITQTGGTVFAKQLGLWNSVNYNMSGGTTNISGDILVSIWSSGVVTSYFTQSGGTLTAGGNLRFGRYNGNAGVYTLSGGSFNVGGNVNLVGDGTTNAAAYLYLNGGTLTANQIDRNGDNVGQQTTAELRFNGGTLRAKGDIDNPNWINFNNGWDRRYNTTRLAIDAGGAIFDTNGRNMGIQQPLPVSWSLGSSQSPAITGGGVTKRGAGTLTLSAGNAYTGNTTVEAGTLTLAHANALLNSTAVLNGGTLAFNAITGATLGGLAGSQNFALQNTGGAAVALAVGNNGANTSYSGAMSGAGSLTKFGGGTLTLGGTSNYTGATAVNAGTLRVNGATGAGALSVANGATLGGGGVIGGAATIQNGGHLAPGNSPGTLTFANGLNLNGGAVLDLELGSSSDLLRVSAGTFSAAAGVKLNLADSGGFGFGSYTLIDFSGATPNGIDPANFTLATTISGPYLYRLSVQGSKLVLTAGPIPPVVTGVTVPLADLYGIGRSLDFTLRFSKAVTVTGTPRLPIVLTSGTLYANYVSGSGGTDLLFRATVASGNSDSDGIALGATFDANGGSVRDAAGTDADPTLAGVPSTAGVKVDGVAPRTNAIRLVGSPPPQSVSVSYTVTFSEAVTGVDAGDFAVETIQGTATGQVGAVSGSGDTYTVAVRNIGGIGTLFVTLKAAGTGIVDAANNPISGGYRLGDPFQASVQLHCYVDAAATGANDGTGWADAYTDLQAAVSNAGCVEIWAAKGVYKPGTTRSDSFRPRAGLKLYGGFAGGETTLDQRGPEVIAAHPTVMSGDIDNNDPTDADGVVLDAAQIAGGNSTNVILMNNAPTTGYGADTIIDGFVVTAGDASTSGGGGGLRCDVASPAQACSFTLTNLVFSGNRALAGGALSVSGNNGNSVPTLSRILFRGNRATNSGGAVSLSATDASGRVRAAFSNVVFSGNYAPNWGGAVGLNVNLGAVTPTFDNVTFSGNVSNAGRGGAIASQAFGGGTSRPTLRNSILWGDGAAGDPEIALDGSGSAVVDQSIVQSGCPGGSATCTNLIAGDPKLGALGDHGGAVASLLPGVDGSAIDTGTCQLPDDQRGVARPQGGGCDVGAIEYRQSTLTATVAGSGAISATAPPVPLSGGIAACTGTCSAIYDGETPPTVTLTATPAPYQSFTGWSGDCSGSDPVATVAMTTARTCTANFTPILFTLSPSVDGGHGSIDPSTDFTIAGGTTTTFTLTPDANYHIAGVDGSCGGSLSGTVYTTHAVIADCSVVAHFAIDQHTVTPGVSAGQGAVDPADPQLVDHGATRQFTLVPAPNYHVDGVDGSCGGSLSGPGNTIYTTDAVNADCSFAVRFAIDQHMVIASVAGGHGAIAPADALLADHGTTLQFVLTPDPNYHVDGVDGSCGGSLSGNVYTTSPIVADCTVVARFAIDQHTVTASVSGGHGTIAPDGAQRVDHGAIRQFTLTPDANYHVDGVDGSCGGSLSGNVFTTSAVTADCTVVARFAIDQHTVTASVSGGHGTIAPAGAQSVDHGATRQFTLTPDANYHVDSVDGSCGGSLSGMVYTTNAVDADCTVVAHFAIDRHTVTPSVIGEHGTISPATAQPVDHGATTQFTVTPAPHYHVDAMGGSCGGQLAGTTYTTDAITADCTVTAKFAIDTHTIGGSVGGLLGSGLVLRLNGANDLSIASNGSFTFASPLDDLGAYAVAIAHQPTSPAQQCIVANGSGVLAGSDVTDILVRCDPPLPHLALSVSDGRRYARYGKLLNYTVSLSNDGEGSASGVTVRDRAPPQIDTTGMSWICHGGGTATCTPSGSGPLLDTAVSIPAGGSLTWEVTAPVRADAPGGTVDYEVDVSGPASAVAIDSDVLVLLRTGFDVIGSDGAESTGGGGSCPGATMPGRSIDAATTFAFELPDASRERLETVLRASAPNGAGLRVERLTLADASLLRLVASGRDGVEHASAWTAAASPLVLGLAANATEASVLLEGATSSLELPLPPDAATEFPALWLLDACH